MKVSVALCTYNGERFLAQQLDSLLNQTGKVDEIVICDDRSQDSTVATLRAYAAKHPSIRLVENQENLGFIRNFEKAIGLTTGDWIFLCDQDDLWLPDKVAAYLRAIEQGRNLGLVFGNAQLIDESGTLLATTLHQAVIRAKLSARKTVIPPRKAHRLLFSGNFITGATVALNRSCLSMLFPFPQQVIHDYWISLCVVLQGYSLGYLDQPLTRYRIHAGQNAGIGLPSKERKKATPTAAPDSRIDALDKALLERFPVGPLNKNLLVPHYQRVRCHRAMRKRAWMFRQPLGKRAALVSFLFLSGEYFALYSGRRGSLFLGAACALRDLVR